MEKPKHLRELASRRAVSARSVSMPSPDVPLRQTTIVEKAENDKESYVSLLKLNSTLRHANKLPFKMLDVHEAEVVAVAGVAVDKIGQLAKRHGIQLDATHYEVRIRPLRLGGYNPVGVTNGSEFVHIGTSHTKENRAEELQALVKKARETAAEFNGDQLPVENLDGQELQVVKEAKVIANEIRQIAKRHRIQLGASPYELRIRRGRLGGYTAVGVTNGGEFVYIGTSQNTGNKAEELQALVQQARETAAVFNGEDELTEDANHQIST